MCVVESITVYAHSASLRHATLDGTGSSILLHVQCLYISASLIINFLQRADDTRVRMYTGFNVDSGRRFLEGKGGYERHDSATTEYPMRYGPEHCPMRQLGGRAGLSSCGQSKSEKPAPQEGGPQGGAEDEGSENDAQDGDDDGKGEKGWRYRFPTTRELCMVSALGVVGGGLWFGLSMLKRRR